MGSEDDACSTSNGVNNVTIRNNNQLKVSVGDCAATGQPGCSSPAFITGGAYPPGCNYASVRVENNYCQGNGTQSAVIYNYVSAVTNASYSNDILGPACSCESGSNC